VLSSDGRDVPFAATEPKSGKAKINVLARIKPTQHDAEYIELLDARLHHIHEHYDGPWSLERWTGGLDLNDGNQLQTTDEELKQIFGKVVKYKHSRLSTEVSTQELGKSRQIDSWDGSYHNEKDSHVVLSIAADGDEPDITSSGQDPMPSALRFSIPPQASFLLADCSSVNKFRNYIRWRSQEYDKSRKFDFILLDPPWDNRSAKRRAAYDTNGVYGMINGMDLSNFLRPGGLVGIWVTNRAAHRDLILGHGGIFESMNVSLAEEWIWLKITTQGEPVTPINGIWRKPYEVLLLGRAPDSPLQLAQPAQKLVRRVIAGVPDFHSRKPCLKALIEPYMPIGYQALEIFARYLVADWVSWGDEVLKYNHETCYEHWDKMIKSNETPA
jgi:N6-adenosine-specific RNA methylase IME4